MNEREQQKRKVVARRVGWLLVAAHLGALLFAFYGIRSAYSIVNNGDPMDTAWAAALWRGIMYLLIAATLFSSSIFLIVRYMLQKRARSQS